MIAIARQLTRGWRRSDPKPSDGAAIWNSSAIAMAACRTPAQLSQMLARRP
jgi:hypothetical protein